ncbi:hypothetical protein JZ751_000222 [Albula glossodonta]|uniref:Uncharacterized protein n=1 Tax=Albula glossodonta TaxID=121402 RepID=A0A8T2PVR8_9TELE|nr:hypothetical protein JZ751_000222 [Albula glossodonta]
MAARKESAATSATVATPSQANTLDSPVKQIQIEGLVLVFVSNGGLSQKRAGERKRVLSCQRPPFAQPRPAVCVTWARALCCWSSGLERCNCGSNNNNSNNKQRHLSWDLSGQPRRRAEGDGNRATQRSLHSEHKPPPCSQPAGERRTALVPIHPSRQAGIHRTRKPC